LDVEVQVRPEEQPGMPVQSLQTVGVVAVQAALTNWPAAQVGQATHAPLPLR
jgi:hypothetical protein